MTSWISRTLKRISEEAPHLKTTPHHKSQEIGGRGISNLPPNPSRRPTQHISFFRQLGARPCGSAPIEQFPLPFTFSLLHTQGDLEVKRLHESPSLSLPFPTHSGRSCGPSPPPHSALDLVAGQRLYESPLTFAFTFTLACISVAT